MTPRKPRGIYSAPSILLMERGDGVGGGRRGGRGGGRKEGEGRGGDRNLNPEVIILIGPN